MLPTEAVIKAFTYNSEDLVEGVTHSAWVDLTLLFLPNTNLVTSPKGTKVNKALQAEAGTITAAEPQTDDINDDYDDVPKKVSQSVAPIQDSCLFY